MSEPKEKVPYLSVEFGEQGGHHEWKNHEEVVNWITQLQNQWSWMNSVGHQPTHNVWSTISSNCNQITSNLQQAINYRNQGNQQAADNHLISVKNSIESFIRPNPWLLPNSSQRRFVEEIRDTRHKLEAGLIVANWMNQDLNGVPIRYVVNALLQWELYERGIKDRMKTESTSLKKLAGDMQTTLTQYQEAERTQTKRFDTLHGELAYQQAAQQKSFDENEQKRTDAWVLQSNTAKQELDNIKNTYDQHMAIAAPVDYWERKRIKHRNMTWASGVAVIFGMIGVGLFLTSKMENISKTLAVSDSATQLSTASSVQAASSVVTSTSASATWQLGIFLMLAVLSIWAIRLLVRIFLSNMHLENDAGERVTMAKTYLALIRSDSLSKEKNIDAVLAALFRPTGDGIVKDEGLPPSAVDFLTKLGNK